MLSFGDMFQVMIHRADGRPWRLRKSIM